MPITSNKDTCAGKPVIQGSRLWVGLIVSNVREMGLDEFLKDYNVSKKGAIEAINYCAGEKCVGICVMYCQECQKRNPTYKEVWKMAQELQRKYSIKS